MRTSADRSEGLPGDGWGGAEATQGFITASDLYLWTHIEAAGYRNIMGLMLQHPSKSSDAWTTTDMIFLEYPTLLYLAPAPFG